MRVIVLSAMMLMLAACGGGGGGSAGGGSDPSPSAPAGGVVNSTTTTASTTSTLLGVDFKEFSSVDKDNVACSTATNATAQIGKVHVAQTHLLETTHPFFQLSADRSAFVRVSVTGQGVAPAVSVKGSVNGADLGTFCLAGPATLPASIDESKLSATTSYTGTVPGAWLKPGLQLVVTAGGASKTLSAAELKIGPAPELTLITTDWLLFGDTEPTPVPAGFNTEFVVKLPLTKVRYADFPIKPALKQLPIGPRGDGRSPNGTDGPQPAVLADRKPSCTDAEKAASKCTIWGGFGVLGAVRDLVGSLQDANGMGWFTHWYGALSKNQHVGGGLGGGSTASGDDYSYTFNHEAGHTFGMPHWGGDLYSRVDANAAQAHPYTGQYTNDAGQPNGGGFGNSWAYDALDSSFVNPVCEASGKERQEPMQRNGPEGCNQSNRAFDHFGDYSALYIHRYFAGAKSNYAGTVSSPRDSLNNTTPRFSFPTKDGRPNLVFNGTSTIPKITQWDEAQKTYTEITPATVSSDSRVFGERYPLQWNVPVYTLWGSFSNATPAATTILDPLKYTGNLKRVWDPTIASDFAAIKAFVSGDAFYWGADLVVKAEFSNGTVKHALIKRTVRGTDPNKGDSFTQWAVNIPAVDGAMLTKVSLYHRPMWVRNPSTDDPLNLRDSSNSSLTAASYMNSARLVSSRTF
jgi:hypothetical protein